jgi:hypothetical protein
MEVQIRQPLAAFIVEPETKGDPFSLRWNTDLALQRRERSELSEHRNFARASSART